ncbi:MAG: hypothetical protein AB1509_11755 [Chloroflexota bacterium]
MQTLKVDDSLPLEVRLVGNIIESSQHRVEGANFDVRKHLLEYDDVLNKQRGQIYGQRDLIFVKEDLSDDIHVMLEDEVKQRVQSGLEDKEGPWKLIAWLEEIQPPFMSGERIFPSFGLSLLLKELSKTDDVRRSTFDLIARAIEAENAHHLHAIEDLLDRTEEAFNTQLASRLDALDAYFDSLEDRDETPRPQKMLEEINPLVGMQIRMNGEQLRLLEQDPQKAKELIANTVKGHLLVLYASRVAAAAANRAGDSLGDKFQVQDWDDAADKILDLTHRALERRRELLVGENGQIERDIHNLMPPVLNDTTKLQLLISLSQGTRTVFNSKTHRQEKMTVQRFSYAHLMAQLLEGVDAEELTEDILTHLEEAQEALAFAIGQAEYARLSSNAVRLADFGEAARRAFGEARLEESAAGLSESDREALVEALGRYALNEYHRRLLLGAITELWVDYLTRIEALRVSINLEAYAQRDPLVQYKARASEMFAQLMEDIRALVISRMFTLQRRPVEIAPVEIADKPAAAQTQAAPQPGGGKKKRRRRS